MNKENLLFRIIAFAVTAALLLQCVSCAISTGKSQADLEEDLSQSLSQKEIAVEQESPAPKDDFSMQNASNGITESYYYETSSDFVIPGDPRVVAEEYPEQYEDEDVEELIAQEGTPAQAAGAAALKNGTYTVTGTSIKFTFKDGTATFSGSGTLPDQVLNKYVDSVTAIVITENVNIGEYSFAIMKNIQSVDIQSGCTSIGGYAFYECTALETLNVAETVTSIGDLAFYGCSGLENLTIPAGITSIPYGGFYGCTGLTELTVPANITRIGGFAFGYCEALQTVTLPEGLEVLADEAFYCCKALTTVNIPASVQTIGNRVFSQCDQLQNVTWQGGNEIGTAVFAQCISLEQITMPNTVTATGGSTFYGCTNLQSVTLSSALSAVSIYDFWECDALEKISLPDSVNAIGYAAFFSCDNLKSIRFPASYVDVGDYAFSYCNSAEPVRSTVYLGNVGMESFYGTRILTSIEFSEDASEIGNEAFTNNTALKKATFHSATLSVGDYAFYGCSALGSVTSLPVLTYVGEAAFNRCSGVTTVSFASECQWIGPGSFQGCENLSAIDFSDASAGIGTAAFSECSALTQVKLSENCEGLADGSFYQCKNLQAVDFSGASISVGDHAFAHCTKLTSTAGEENIVSLGSYCFNQCAALSAVSGFTSLQEVGECTFAGCASISSGFIPDGMDTVPRGLYNFCTRLSSVTIPDGISAIDEYAFSGCENLSTVEIPDSVSTIGEAAFARCTNLKYVTGGNSVEILDDLSFAYCEKLQSAGFGSWLQEIGYAAFYNCAALADISWISGLTRLEDSAFMNCSSIKRVLLPDYMEHIGKYAFENCTGLTYAEIGEGPDILPAELFCGCSALTEVIIPSSVTILSDSVFHGCTALQQIELPYDLMRLGDGVFYNCSSLTSIELPDTLQEIGRSCFKDCISLREVIMPDQLRHIEDGCFYNCSSLSSVTMPTSSIRIGYAAFYQCSALSQIDLPEDLSEIGEYAFAKCAKLKDVQLPGSLRTLGDSAFAYCTSISEITLPRLISEIRKYAFYGCSALESADCLGSILAIGTGAFFGCRNLTALYLLGGAPISIGEQALSDTHNDLILYGSDQNEEWTAPAWEGPDQLLYRTLAVTPETSGSCGAGAQWGYDPDSEILIISGFGEMDDYGSSTETPWSNFISQISTVIVEGEISCIGQRAFSGYPMLRSVYLGEGVERIGEYAFAQSENLRYLSMPQSLRHIEGYAFYHCIGLTQFTLPDQLEEIGAYSFYSCSAMDAITIPDSVNALGDGAFGNCSGLETLILPAGLDEVPERAFSGCMNLRNVILPENVRQIGQSAFANCADLESVYFLGSGVRVADYAFSGCTGLNTLSFADTEPSGLGYRSFGKTADDLGVTYLSSSWKAKTLTTADGQVLNCTSDSAIQSGSCGSKVSWSLYDGGILMITGSGTMTNFSSGMAPWNSLKDSIRFAVIANGVNSVGSYAFSGCSRLEKVLIPESVTVIGEAAFSDCDALESVKLPNTMTSLGKSAFYHCDRLSGIVLPAGVTTLSDYAFGLCTALKRVELGTNLTSIGYGAFYGCESLDSLLIPEGVTSIGDWAFARCTGLQQMELPETTNSLGAYLFFGCSGLQNVSLPGSLTELPAYIFAGSGIDTIELPDSAISIGERAFWGCGNLTQIDLNQVQNIGQASFFESGLTDVEIPGQVGSIAPYAFGMCGNLQDITVDSANASYCDLDGVLYSADGTQLLQYPTGRLDDTYEVDSQTQIIGLGAFYGAQVAQLILPDSLTQIQEAAFALNENLQQINIPAQITDLPLGVFGGCDTLTEVTFDADAPAAIEADAFWNTSNQMMFLYNQDAHGWTNHRWTGPDGVQYATRRIGAEDFEISLMSSAINEETQIVTHNIRIDNNTSSEADASVFAALYQDGKMLAVTSSPIPLEANTYYDLSVSVSGGEVDYGTTLKLFLLEGSGFYPLSDDVTVESEFDLISEDEVKVEIGAYISEPILPSIPGATDVAPVEPGGGSPRTSNASTVSVRLDLEEADLNALLTGASEGWVSGFDTQITTGYQGASLQRGFTTAVDYAALDEATGFTSNGISVENPGAVPESSESTRGWMPAASGDFGTDFGRKRLSDTKSGTFSPLSAAVSETAADTFELVHSGETLFSLTSIGLMGMEEDASCTGLDDGSYAIVVPWWGTNLQLNLQPEQLVQAVLESRDTAQLTGANLEGVYQVEASICVSDSTVCTVLITTDGAGTVEDVSLLSYAQIEEEIADRRYIPQHYDESTKPDESAPVQINTVSPSKGANGLVTVCISGNMLEAAHKVQLVGAGETIDALQQYYFDHNKMYATFDLTNAADGVYDLRVGGADEEALLSQCFTVDGTLPKGELTATLNIDKKAKVGKEYNGSITYVNTGYTDVYAPVVLFDCGNIELCPEEGDGWFYQQSVFVPNQDGLAGIVANGETAAFNFKYKVTSKKGFVVNVYNYSTLTVDVAEAIELTEESSATDILNWNSLQLTGIQACDFADSIARMASVQDSIGARCDDLNTLRNAYLLYAQGVASGADLYQSTDLSSRELTLQRSYSTDITLRQNDGLWGKGWISNYDITAEFNEATTDEEISNILLTSSGNISVFSLKDGVYLEAINGKATAEINGSIITVHYPDQSKMIFNEQGKLSRTEDAYGNYTELTYDGEQKLISVSTSNSDVLEFTYTDGKVSSVTSKITGLSTQYTYQGDLLVSASGVFGSERYEYDQQSIGAGRFALTGVTYATGLGETFTYDELGRLISTENALGVTTLDYSETGSILTTDPSGEQIRTYLDTTGASRRVLCDEGSMAQSVYSDPLTLTEERFGRSLSVRYTYDDDRNMTTLTNPAGGIVSYSYDAMGNLTGVTDPGGVSMCYQYNSVGAVTGTLYSDGTATNCTYDDRGRLATAVKRDGTEMTYAYNDASQLAEIRYSTGQIIRYSYDDRGNLIMIEENGQQTFLQYNSRNELTAIRYPGSSSVEYGYDAYGNLIRITAHYGTIRREYRYEYDQLGRLTGSYFGDVLMSSYEYNPDGSVSRETCYTGAYTEYSYEKGMISSIENYAPDDELLSFFRYDYDAEGNLISMEEKEGTWTYGYDKTAQLTSATAPDGKTTVYTYDLSGNRTSKVTSQGIISYEANELNQYTSFGSTQRAYDLNGNLISQTDETGTTKYEYDYQDRLIRTLEPDGTSTEYTYDVFGNRASIRIDGELTEFINTPTGYGQALTAIRNGFVESDYIQGNGLVGRICYDQETDSLHFFDYSYNHLGSTSEITDESGNVVNSYRYDQEGNVISSTEGMENPFTYIGQYGITDDGNGLYYVRARYLSQDTLSFISPDPSGQSGGLNLYCYANNNPVMYVDINGEICILAVLAIGAIAGAIGGAIIGGCLAYRQTDKEKETGVREADFKERMVNGILGGAAIGAGAGALVAVGGYYIYGLYTAGTLGTYAATVGTVLSKAGNVLKNNAIKAFNKSTAVLDKYGKALAAESEAAALSSEVKLTAEAMKQAARTGTTNPFNVIGSFFAVLGSSITATTMVGSSNPAIAAPTTISNINSPVSYSWQTVDTTDYCSGSVYLENGVLKGYVSESYIPVPNSSRVIPKGYETFLKNNPGIDNFGTPIIFENNTMTTGTPAPGILDGLWDLFLNNFKWW